jgi:hypothetical protein
METFCYFFLAFSRYEGISSLKKEDDFATLDRHWIFMKIFTKTQKRNFKAAASVTSKPI